MSAAKIEYHVERGMMPTVSSEGITLTDDQKYSIRSEVAKAYHDFIIQGSGVYSFSDSIFDGKFNNTFDFRLEENPFNVRGPSIIFTSDSCFSLNDNYSDSCNHVNSDDIIKLGADLVHIAETCENLINADIFESDIFRDPVNRGYLFSVIISNIAKLTCKNEIYYNFIEIIRRAELADADNIDNLISFKSRYRHTRLYNFVARVLPLRSIKKNGPLRVIIEKSIGKIPKNSEIYLVWGANDKKQP